MEELSSEPEVSSFRPLSEHQEATPETFFGGQLVLHARAPEGTLIVAHETFEKHGALRDLKQPLQVDATANGTHHAYVEIDGLQVWVTSSDIQIWSPRASKGVRIFYPSLFLQAIGPNPTSTASQAILLQVNEKNHDAVNSDEEYESLEIYIVPTAISTDTPGASDGHTESPLHTLFNAITTCANLHVEPRTMTNEIRDDDHHPIGSVSAEGSGWITAENLDDFIDSNGNFVGPARLGAGAGAVHSRDDDSDTSMNGEEDGGDTKWQRTD